MESLLKFCAETRCWRCAGFSLSLPEYRRTTDLILPDMSILLGPLQHFDTLKCEGLFGMLCRYLATLKEDRLFMVT